MGINTEIEATPSFSDVIIYYHVNVSFSEVY